MVDRSDAASFETAFHSEPHDTRQPDTSEHEPIMVAATETPAAPAPQAPAAVGGFAVEKVETFDAAAVKLQITAEDGKIIELPADTQISAILVDGDDLLIKEVNGDLILIKGGLKHMPTLHLGTIEIPSAALSASLTANGVTLPAAGDQGNAQGQNKSSGNHFGPDAGNIGDPFHVHGLLPFSEIDRGFGNLPPLQGGFANRGVSIGAIAAATVFEHGIDKIGSEESLPAFKDDDITTGSFTISAPDGVASLTIGGVEFIHNGALVGGAKLDAPHGQLIVTAYDAGTGTVTYQYTLLTPADHAPFKARTVAGLTI